MKASTISPEELRAEAESLSGGAPAFADDGDATGGRGPSIASLMVAMLLDAGELFASPTGDAYITTADTRATMRLESQGFRDWALARFYELEGKTGRDASVKEAVSTLSGIARSKSERIAVSVRAVANGGAYYLDLAQTGNARCIDLRPGSWKVLDAPPAAVRFLRSATMQSLPLPHSGGDLCALWSLVNVPAEMRPAVLVWLIECLRTDTPCPVLELIGEHGSAKSTTSRILRRLIDPNTADLRAAPASPQDLFVTGAGVGVVTMENVSHLSPALQDACCRVATGGGFATRKLHTNDEESVIFLKRPVLINGIATVVTAQDLVDRTISVELPRVPERIEAAGLHEEFDNNHAHLLGGLLDLAAAALERLPQTVIPLHRRPRLLEYARLGCAVSECLGDTADDFLDAFEAMRTQAIGRTIEGSAVAMAVLDWWNSNGKGQHHETTAARLMKTVEFFKPAGADTWPRSPKGFADGLRRMAPALREFGIEVRAGQKRGGTIPWFVRPTQDMQDMRT